MTTEQANVDVLSAPQVVISDETNRNDADLLRRFSADRDAKAFELLVRRHGPMVLSICRRMLRDPHAAEDAFQATFLVLVRKAASIRKPEMLGSWLHGVALRTASRARAQAGKRNQHEMRTAIMLETEADTDVEGRELRAVLDEEIGQLPKRYREPLIFCYLQEKTHAEAARLLGCPVGSMSSRLAAAREKLRARLSRRGLTVSAGLFAAVLFENTARSELSSALVHATVSNAMWGATGQAAGVASSHAVDLANDVLHHMSSVRLRMTAFALLMALFVGLLTYRAADTVYADRAAGQEVPARAGERKRDESIRWGELRPPTGNVSTQASTQASNAREQTGSPSNEAVRKPSSCGH